MKRTLPAGNVVAGRCPSYTTAFLVGVLAMVSWASADEVRYAARPVSIRQGNHAFDQVVGAVPLGQPVNVIGHEGRWLRVSYSPVSFATTQSTATAIVGYVFEDALATQPPPPATQPADNKNVPTPGGVLNSTEYAVTNGLDPDALAKSIADSQNAMKNADAKFDAFIKAGHLGRHKTGVSPATRPTTQPAQ